MSEHDCQVLVDSFWNMGTMMDRFWRWFLRGFALACGFFCFSIVALFAFVAIGGLPVILQFLAAFSSRR